MLAYAQKEAVTCPRCGEDKPPSGFNKDSHRENGLYYCCRDCQLEYDRERYRRAMQDPEYRRRKLDRNRAYRAKNRAYLQALKERPCEDCGAELPPEKMHFHHPDPDTKFREPGQLVRNSRAKLNAEVAKCVLLCNSCHGKRHARGEL